MIHSSTFTENEAWRSSGGVLSADDVRIEISSSAFISNRAGFNGGVIDTYYGHLSIASSLFENNTAADSGGAIDCGICFLVVDDTLISHNVAGQSGGGIFAGAAGKRMRLSNCTISHNTAGQRDDADYAGGGVFAKTTATISHCHIMHNTSDIGGGLVIVGDADVTNSVIAKNSAVKNAGGIYLGYGEVTLTHVSIMDNFATQGGGVYKDANATHNLRNTIIANNKGGDCFGRLAENIGNLIADGSCFAELMGNPMLGDLVEPDDGSPAYFPLLEGSPAIDAADDEFCPDTDITGTPRPQGAACDIGAYELPQ